MYIRKTVSLLQMPSAKKLAWVAFLTLPIAIADSAQAQITDYLTVQPIQVCDDFGLNCANPSLEFFEAETDKIWDQAGIDVLFLGANQLDDTSLLNITSTADVDLPGNGQHPDSSVINMWFVNDYVGAFGAANSSAGRVAIADSVYSFNSGVGRLDTIAHELGHILGLGHNDFGAGGANNLMTTGSIRNVPGSINDIAPDGANVDQLTQAQIDEALTSRFLSPIPEVTVDTFGSTPFSTDDFFHVTFADGPNNKTLDWLTLDLSPVNAFFDPTDTIAPGLDGSPFALSSLNSISASDIVVSGDTDGSQLLRIDFLNDAFEVGDSFDFGIDIDLFSKVDQFGAEPFELEGALFTFGFSDQYTVTAELRDSIASSHLPITNSGLTQVPETPTSLPVWISVGSLIGLSIRTKRRKGGETITYN